MKLQSFAHTAKNNRESNKEKLHPKAFCFNLIHITLTLALQPLRWPRMEPLRPSPPPPRAWSREYYSINTHHGITLSLWLFNNSWVLLQIPCDCFSHHHVHWAGQVFKQGVKNELLRSFPKDTVLLKRTKWYNTLCCSRPVVLSLYLSSKLICDFHTGHNTQPTHQHLPERQKSLRQLLPAIKSKILLDYLKHIIKLRRI